MKNLLLLVFFCSWLGGVAQTDSLPAKSSPVNVMPSFPGGEQAMFKFIQENVKYPKKERKHNISGKCVVEFVVEKDGSLSNIKIASGIPNGEALENEAMRVVGLMPKWKPGTQDGKVVRVQFNLPIKFTLSDKKQKK